LAFGSDRRSLTPVLGVEARAKILRKLHTVRLTELPGDDEPVVPEDEPEAREEAVASEAANWSFTP